MMKIKIFMLVTTAIVPFISGCISCPMAVSPVGPDPMSRATSGLKGYLQVFSATETCADELMAIDFHPHSGYDIKDESGKPVKFVPNRASIMDEWPDQVPLPIGNYSVVARSTWCGLVTVPVLIQRGKLTVVHLDDNWFPSSKGVSNQLVYLPNGESVGWTRSTAKSSN